MGYAIQSIQIGSFSPTFTGLATSPTNVVFNYQLIGKICYWSLWMQDAVNGTGTTFTFTLPFTSKNTANYQQQMPIASYINAGAFGTVNGKIVIQANSNIATCYINQATGAWTNTATDRRLFTNGFYIIE